MQCRSADRCCGTNNPVRCPFWRGYNRTTQICCSVLWHLQPSAVSLFAGVQPCSADLLIGAVAPTTQCGAPFGGGTTVQHRSAARCPGTFSPVRSPFLWEYNRTVQCRSADRCCGTNNPVRSPFLAGVQPYNTDLLIGAPASSAQYGLPFWRECNRTI